MTALFEFDELTRENRYLRARAEQLAASLVRADTVAATIRHELEQKRRGFMLMAELSVTLGRDAGHGNAFFTISRRINGALNMERTVVLTPQDGGGFVTSVMQGYEKAEEEALAAQRIDVPAEMLDPLNPILVTKTAPEDYLADIRQTLALPYLISTPVVLHGAIVAILVTGRVREQKPFLPRLGRSDVETVQALGAYLAAVMASKRLQEAENRASHDHLTGLPNLRLVTQRLHGAVALASRAGFKTAVMFIDLDGFKSINDSLGHAAGDDVLRSVSERLRTCVRESDTVGRIGGDEFIVILSHMQAADSAGIVAGKMIGEINRPIEILGQSCRVGASIGIAVFPDHGEEPTTLLRLADESMYGCKRAGKNAFRFAERPACAPS